MARHFWAGQPFLHLQPARRGDPAIQKRVLADMQQDYMSLLSAARVMFKDGDVAGAQDVVRLAVELQPQRPVGIAILAMILSESGDLEQAAFQSGRLLALAPDDRQYRNLATSLALRRGRFAEAEQLAEQALRVSPDDQRARCDLVLARHAQGKTTGGLLEYAAHVATLQATPPPDFDTIEQFNTIIAESITEMLADDPGQGAGTLVGGLRLDNAFDLPKPLAHALRHLITDCVGRYLDGREPARKRARYGITAWANVMEAGQYERTHIHESGWISGVYYPKIPDLDRDQDEGRLLFGEHHFGDSVPALPCLSILPDSGQVVLFPSYLYHRTLAFSAQGKRISVAFDIAP